MELPVINSKSKSLKVPDSLFNQDINDNLINQLINSYIDNGHQGTKAQKNRSQVSGGGKKPWKQKGTGRARAGTTRGPIWRGGGVTFASGKRNFKEKINKKMYNGAMRSIMSELLRTDRVVAIDKIDLKEIKTKEMHNILKKYDLKSVLIITNDINEKIFLSARNIKDVGIATVDYLDPPLLLSYKKVLIVKDALISFEKRFGA